MQRKLKLNRMILLKRNLKNMKKLLTVKNIVKYPETQINIIIWQDFMNFWEEFPTKK